MRGMKSARSWIEDGEVKITDARILGQLSYTQGDNDLPEGDVEVEKDEAIKEESGKAGDLIQAGILPEIWFIRLGCIDVFPHGLLPFPAFPLWRRSRKDMGRGGESFQS